MIEMLSTKSKIIAGVGAGLVASLMAVGPVEAQQTSDFIESASIMAEPNHEVESQRLWAGIDECMGLAADEEAEVDEEIISADFESLPQFSLADNSVFEGVYLYSRERGSTTLNCRQTDGIDERCTVITDDDSVTREANEVRVRLPFSQLTDVVHDGVEEANGGNNENGEEENGEEENGEEENGDTGSPSQAIESVDDCRNLEGLRDRDYYIQLSLDDSESIERSEVRLTLDLIRPDSPVLTDAWSTEHSIGVEFDPSESDDVEQHRVAYATQQFEQGELVEDITDFTPLVVGGAEEGQISVDLEPGQTVYVAMISEDETGNFSVVSEPMETTVLETDGFWDMYVESGGDEQGGYGCQSAAGAGATLVSMVVVMLMALAGRLLGKRRSRQEATVETGGRRDSSSLNGGTKFD